jgi:hypothetical protein
MGESKGKGQGKPQRENKNAKSAVKKINDIIITKCMCTLVK